MGDRGEDRPQMTTCRIRTRVAVIRTEPIWYALLLLSLLGAPGVQYFKDSRVK